jgi:hypothetical protein
MSAGILSRTRRPVIQERPGTQRLTLYFVSTHPYRLDADPIINRRLNPLLAAQLSLRCLKRYVSYQELSLFQFPALRVPLTSG